MNRGKIKFFSEQKGFGFIQVKGESAPVDIFVHATGFSDEIEDVYEGEEVLFDVVMGKRGFSAINVQRA